MAIQLTFQHEGRTNKAVLGWTGLPASVAPPPVGRNNSATSAAADRIEIDPQFAAMLGPGLEEGTKVCFSPLVVLRASLLTPSALQVNVEMLRDLPHATTVNVTPSSADDWEVLVRPEREPAATPSDVRL